jgi:hypothetical protein
MAVDLTLIKGESDGSDIMRQQVFLLEERERRGSMTWPSLIVGFGGVEVEVWIGGSERCVKSGLRAKSGDNVVCFDLWKLYNFGGLT